ncbi:hypothetical protein AVEN_122988-1 [Araneus ventricosus]|uniref:Integrase p58-like C-terminal domain-containing protein n=1 Tax=Araneus ventricosus TaxID=182803 RepID=A0A4Y2CUB0_ARAVE|nr:hypothetical protein AVEN_122988-1 [Araneus ventricosus]
MQATNSVNIIPFDPNNSMNVNSWLKYFNDKCQEYNLDDKCQEYNLDDKWKLNNITAYLKNSALTEYVNSYDTIKTWEEFVSFLTERYISPIGQNSYYEPVNEARNLALQRTIDYHNKNKIRSDARFVDKKFNPGDLVVYEEFHYPNTRKLSPPFSGPYEIIKQCSEVTYEINKPNPLTKQATQIVHISKLRCFHSPDKLKLSHE